MAKFKKVIRSTYDGYITVVWSKSVAVYEGVGLCPPQIKKWLRENDPEHQDCFWNEVRS
jgi:hypothetical protein